MFMTLRIALRALGRNRVRSALTMLGVIIGVAAVIAMVAIGQGATQSIQKQVASMGQNIFIVHPGDRQTGSVSNGSGAAQTLTPGDERAIADECPSLRVIGLVVRTSGQVVRGSENWRPMMIQGCDPAFLDARDWPVIDGSCFSDDDVRAAAQVCVLGQTVADALFANENPLGKRVNVKGLPFRVVGVLARKGANTWGSDQDDVLIMPWTTCKKKLQGSAFDNVDMFFASAVSPGAMDDLEQEMSAVLRARHHIPQNEEGEWQDDFELHNLTEIMNTMTSMTRTMTALLAAIASVSLLVGGIGIMNIMLVSVTERTREIGLRMAIGARGRDVLMQFLVEAVTLAAMGGLLGIALGGGGAVMVARMFQWPAIISVRSIVIAVAFSGAVGVAFGFYPAWRASKLDPIDALRYE